MNYSEVESKVREATNDDTWGPHGSLMQEVARYTFTYEHFPEVMSMLWKRMLQEQKKYWRRSYKVTPSYTHVMLISGYTYIPLLYLALMAFVDSFHRHYFYLVIYCEMDLRG
jgi:hypothetical protein